MGTSNYGDVITKYCTFGRYDIIDIVLVIIGDSQIWRMYHLESHMRFHTHIKRK